MLEIRKWTVGTVGEPVSSPMPACCSSVCKAKISSVREIKSFVVCLGLLMASGKPLIYGTLEWGQDTWVSLLQSGGHAGTGCGASAGSGM